MRRRRITKRELTPDVKYNSELVARLINTLMRNGKKTVAQSIVYGAFDVIKSKKKDMEPLEVFIQAVPGEKGQIHDAVPGLRTARRFRQYRFFH